MLVPDAHHEEPPPPPLQLVPLALAAPPSRPEPPPPEVVSPQPVTESVRLTAVAFVPVPSEVREIPVAPPAA
jgi:hypothetical protein